MDSGTNCSVSSQGGALPFSLVVDAAEHCMVTTALP